MMVNYIQFVTSILLLIGHSSALPTNSNDRKLDRRLLTPGMGLINVDLSDLRILSPESNTFKLNYIGGVGNYHGPNVVYFDPFAQPGQEQPKFNMGPLGQAPSQPQPGQYINTQQVSNKSQDGQLPQAPNQAQGKQQAQQQPQKSNQPQPDQKPPSPNQAQSDQTQAPTQSPAPKKDQATTQSRSGQQLPAPNQIQAPTQPPAPKQAQVPTQSRSGQQFPAPNQTQPDQNQSRW